MAKLRKPGLFFPTLFILFFFPVLFLAAFPGDIDVLTAELWAELDPIPLAGETLPVLSLIHI